jgi:hypothetical protein
VGLLADVANRHKIEAKCDAIFCPGPPGPIKEWLNKDIEDVLGFCLPYHAHDDMAGKLIPVFYDFTNVQNCNNFLNVFFS